MRTTPSGRVTPTGGVRPTLSPRQDSLPTAVLIDGTALFLAARTLYEGHQLNYRALVDILRAEISLRRSTSDLGADRDLWVMWTSASAQNQGQARFLDFAENELGWEVRRFAPIDSYVVEPTSAFNMGTDSRAANRLMRFDSSIAFAMGRLAHDHKIIVVSDSYGLAEPMMRVNAIQAGDGTPPILAFFGRALDPRWPRVLTKKNENHPDHIDLDDSAAALFGELAQSTPQNVKGGEGKKIF